jgi:acyl carrier protein
LAKYRVDGAIEFLGRIDHQVKVRGYRIELGEIEAVIEQHLLVRECVVVARQTQIADMRLVAYLVASDEASGDDALLDGTQMRNYLNQKLPDYMVPSAYVLLDEMPLTANGKVDLQKLPAPEEGRTQKGQEYVGPQNEDQQILAEIWQEVLAVERVGINDNFFELGGHSLLGSQLVSKLRQTFQVELPLSTLFEAPTIAGFAQAVEEARGNSAESSFSEIVPVSRDSYRMKPLADSEGFN